MRSGRGRDARERAHRARAAPPSSASTAPSGAAAAAQAAAPRCRCAGTHLQVILRTTRLRGKGCDNTMVRQDGRARTPQSSTRRMQARRSAKGHAARRLAPPAPALPSTPRAPRYAARADCRSQPSRLARAAAVSRRLLGSGTHHDERAGKHTQAASFLPLVLTMTPLPVPNWQPRRAENLPRYQFRRRRLGSAMAVCVIGCPGQPCRLRQACGAALRAAARTQLRGAMQPPACRQNRRAGCRRRPARRLPRLLPGLLSPWRCPAGADRESPRTE